MAWSFCNEGGCGSGSNHTVASAFRDVAYAYDGTRKVSGNMRKTVGPGTLSDILDVQGLSHPQGEDMDTVHDLPSEANKALIASECCSCMTMRGENHRNTSISRPVPSNFNADCLSEQVNRSDDGRPWSVGSMVWTLFDYFGKPPDMASPTRLHDVLLMHVPCQLQANRTGTRGPMSLHRMGAMTWPAFRRQQYGGIEHCG